MSTEKSVNLRQSLKIALAFAIALSLLLSMQRARNPPRTLAEVIREVGGTVNKRRDGAFLVELSGAVGSVDQLNSVVSQFDEVAELWLTDLESERIARLLRYDWPSLKTIKFFNCKIGDQLCLVRLPLIENICISKCETKFAEKPFFISCQNAVDLRMSESKLTPNVFAGLTGLKTLKVLLISKLPEINDAELASIKDLPILQELYLSNTGISGRVLFGQFASSRTLKLLDVHLSDFGKEGCLAIQKFESLEVLHVTGNEIDIDCLRIINQMPRLRELAISDFQVSTEAALSILDSSMVERLIIDSADEYRNTKVPEVFQGDWETEDGITFQRGERKGTERID